MPPKDKLLLPSTRLHDPSLPAKLLHDMDETESDQVLFRKLPSTTDLALHTMKLTIQTVG